MSGAAWVSGREGEPALYQRDEIGAGSGRRRRRRLRLDGGRWRARCRPAHVAGRARGGRSDARADGSISSSISARDIGTPRWWRGLATCSPCASPPRRSAPGFSRSPGAVPAPLHRRPIRAKPRAQAIAPLALAATPAAAWRPTDAVAPLTDTPERPIDRAGRHARPGRQLRPCLDRAGVGAAEAEQVADLVAGAVTLGDIAPGTRDRHDARPPPSRDVARPLDQLAFRARFDLRAGDRPRRRRAGPGAQSRSRSTTRRCASRAGSAAASTVAARAAGAPARRSRPICRRSTSRSPIARHRRRRPVRHDRRPSPRRHRRDRDRRAALCRPHQWQRRYRSCCNGRRTAARNGSRPSGVGETARRHARCRSPAAHDLQLRHAPPPDPRLFAHAPGHRLRRAAMARRSSRRPTASSSFAGWHGGHGNYVKLDHGGGSGHRLCAYEPHRGRSPAQQRPARPGDRLCRLDRPLDRPAPPLRGLSQRRGDQPAIGDASPASCSWPAAS